MKKGQDEGRSYQSTAFGLALDALHKQLNARKVTTWHNVQYSTSFERALIHLLQHLRAELPQKIPEHSDSSKALAEALQQVGVMHREVWLEAGWSRHATGAMLAQRADGEFVCLIPSGSGYSIYDHADGTRRRATRADEARLQSKAHLLYPPLPRTSLTKKELVLFLVRQLTLGDVFSILAATLLTTLLGFVLPWSIQILYHAIIPGQTGEALLPLLLMLCCVPLSVFLLRVIRGTCVHRVQSRLSLFSLAAVMGRLLQLPATFFKKYDAGDLAKRTAAAENLSSSLADILLTTGLSALFSMVYLTQIAAIEKAFLLPAILIALLSIGISSLTIVRQVRYATRVNQDGIALSSQLYDYLSDVQKIKLGGVERLVFANWITSYVGAANWRYNRPFILRMGAALSEAVMGAGMLAIYIIAVEMEVGVSNFVAFLASFGLMMGALTSMVTVLQGLAQMVPNIQALQPILQEMPEKQPVQKSIYTMSGHLRLEHISFGYAPELPNIFKDLTLDIPPGQYLGIVGHTGSGKSTILRLLLGFEKPQSGTIYVDGNRLAELNLQSYRRNLGIVLQNGTLISGSIKENILLSAPWLGEEEAWRAARIASIDKEIQALPLGMETVVSNTSRSLSGGQKQRLLIARAVASNPRVLFLDEATSSLDNETQANVMSALDHLDCTRVVVAHRLSTIERCDRIIVLDKGGIAEDGSYAELMQKGGILAKLVARQQVDKTISFTALNDSHS